MSVTTEGESTAEPSAGLRRASGFGPLVLRGLPLGPAWAGVGVFAVYLGLWLGIMNLIGLLDGFRLMISVPGHGLLLGQFVWESPLGWFSGVNALLISYLIAALLHSRRGSLRDLNELHPALRWSDTEFSTRRDRIFSRSRANTISTLILGSLFGVAITFLDDGMWGGHDRPSLTEPYLAVVATRNALVGMLFALLGNREFNLALAFFRLGRREVEVDLWDQRPLAPFGRKGQRSVFIWMLALGIFSLFFFSPAPGWTNAITVAFGLSLAGIGFLLPVLGVRRSILSEKRQELDQLSRESARERQRLFPSAEANPSMETAPTGVLDARLTNLLSYKTMVEQAGEWPFGASTLARVGFFRAIGIGSWVGGAGVEQLLSSALE